MPAGYLIELNATEYEFDVNVYSPVGTVVFEALFVAENINELVTILVRFAGNLSELALFSINETGMDSVTFNSPIETNPLLTITLDEALDPNDDQVVYTFTLDYATLASGVPLRTKSSFGHVILHEIGKLYSSSV